MGAKRRLPIASKNIRKPEVTIGSDESFTETDDSFNEESSQLEDSVEENKSVETIKDLTKQLSELEDKYVDEKAENANKTEMIRKLTVNIEIMSNKFDELKTDRSDLVKYMKQNADLIEKMKVLSAGLDYKKKEVKLLQQKAESPKVSEKIKKEIEDMKTVMIGQNRQIIEMEEKLREDLKEESNRKKEMVKKEKELKKIKAELEAKKSDDS